MDEAETKAQLKSKVIAFYLPQYHVIPENDKAYGVGFTEWTNVRKARPLYEGHNQPRIPEDGNYYSLLSKEVMIEQASLAKQYGVYGFCYYHYWFKNGKKLLEKPIEMMLKTPEIDIPFCLCWANENWTKRWDGGNNEVIVEQDYGDISDLNNHIDYLCEFFKDERYIRIDGKPLLLIYRPELIPNLSRMVKIIRERVKKNGFSGIVLATQHPDYYFAFKNKDFFDYYVQFEPLFIQSYEIEKKGLLKSKIKHFLLSHNMRTVFISLQREYQKRKKRELVHRDYDKDWQSIIDYPVDDKKLIAGAFVDWDNTPRNQKGIVYDGTSVEKFRTYFKKLVVKVQEEYSTDYIFINAWNEWAEGAYLEADEKNGLGFLNAIKDSLTD